MTGKQREESRKQRAFIARCACTALFCFLLSALAFAKNGAFKSTAHGDAQKGPQRRADRPRGSCSQCHDQHSSHDPGAPRHEGAALFTSNDENLCFACHGLPSDDGVFPGPGGWADTAHARMSVTQNNRCASCHEPHGVKDRDGVVPALLSDRESAVCFTCHDGSRAADVRRDFEKTYRHPIGTVNRHHAGEKDPSAFAAIPANNRHSECSDCHNSHRIGTSAAPPLPPQASNRLAGVSRVEVSNGGAALVPNFVWRGADDPNPANEYEICFKCHSSFAPQRPGQSNLALLTNPANPSFHPIQAQGKNAHIDPSAFANGYDAQSILLCTDCHTSDDPVRKGPHGSSYRYILRKPATTSVEHTTMTQDDLCFHCHAYRVYGDASASANDQALSRFNAPVTAGHTYHVAVQRIPCYACHETHGSTRNAALIATRNGGVTRYTQTPLGGTCVTGCHQQQNYTLNYPR